MDKTGKQQQKNNPQSELSDRLDYRSKIYSSYVTTHSELAWHESAMFMQRRGHVLKDLILKHFPADRDALIVDLGCGHGGVIHFANQLGFNNIKGVDRSPEQVKLASELGITEVEEEDLMVWLKKCLDNTYDAVISFDIVEHFTKTEFVNFTNEVNRILKPNGRWLIHTCNGDSPFFGSSAYNDFTHEIFFNTRSAKQVLYAFGFTSVNTFEDAPVIHGFFSFIRLLLWKLLVFGYRMLWAIEKGELQPDAVFSRDFLVVAIK